jgi:hypothetical protein
MSPPRSSRRLKKDSPQKSFFPFEGQSWFFISLKNTDQTFCFVQFYQFKKWNLKSKHFFNWPWMWHCGPFLYLLFYFIATSQWRVKAKSLLMIFPLSFNYRPIGPIVTGIQSPEINSEVFETSTRTNAERSVFIFQKTKQLKFKH